MIHIFGCKSNVNQQKTQKEITKKRVIPLFISEK